ncbi:DUF4381 domain-containing protein [Photobacterium kagoshimensis]|uniref:DUF4381 domain-containing protein n=1 Tax=Photobacterium kagoshimensis TaxID=2910242 RepID=UPI003D131A72
MSVQSTSTLPLADIVLPPPPSPWVFAWGWWALAILLLIAIGITVWRIRHYRQTHKAQKAALALLAQHRVNGTLSDINTVLRQAALSYFPRERVASLTGNAWLAFLDQQCSTPSQAGFVSNEAIWLRGLFAMNQLTPEEYQQCYRLAEAWLKHALPPSSNKLNTDVNSSTIKTENNRV